MSALAIFVPRRFIRLMVSDAKNIARDPMLMAVCGLSIGPAAGFWFGRVAMDDAALGAFGVAQFSSYLVPVVLVLPALLIGWVTGFLMLEDRDDGALLALDVTPPGKAGFLAYRVTVTAGLAAGVTSLPHRWSFRTRARDWSCWLRCSLPPRRSSRRSYFRSSPGIRLRDWP